MIEMFYFIFYNALDLNKQKSLCLPSIFRFERKLGFLTTLLNGKQLLIFNKFWSFDPTVHCQQMLYIWSSSRKIWEKLAIQRRQIHKKLLKTVKSDIEFLRGWINMYTFLRSYDSSLVFLLSLTLLLYEALYETSQALCSEDTQPIFYGIFDSKCNISR